MLSSLIFIIFWISRNMQLGGTDFDTDEEIEEALLHFLRGLVGDRYDSKIKK